MTISFDLSPEQLAQLTRRAALRGKSPEAYVLELLEQNLTRPALDEILAPLREQVEASGITDEELDTLFDEARNEVAQENRVTNV